MRILFAHIMNEYDGKPILGYSHSLVRELRAKGHEVVETSKDRKEDAFYKDFDLFIDMDSGRDLDQSYKFHLWQAPVPCKSAAIFIDSHGKPDEHQYISRHADHVFFAVWDRRDLFADHKSAHWLPNFTDLEHFNRESFNTNSKTYDFCFFGSKGGLDRADMLKAICDVKKWTYDIDEVGRKGKHRWPRTAERMAACRFGFNHGQKHDGPNLRVMETMAMGLPLISDFDKRSGMGYLFEPWQHYIPYEAYTYEGLEERMQWCISNHEKAAKIADQAYKEVCKNHLAIHRVEKVLEVVC